MQTDIKLCNEIILKQDGLLARLANVKVSSIFPGIINFLFLSCEGAPPAILVCPLSALLVIMINFGSETKVSDYWFPFLLFFISWATFFFKKSKNSLAARVLIFPFCSSYLLLIPTIVLGANDIYMKSSAPMVEQYTISQLSGHDIKIDFDKLDNTHYYLMHDGTGRSSDHKNLSWKLKGSQICIDDKCLNFNTINGQLSYRDVVVGTISDISQEGTTKPWQLITELIK